MKNRRHSFSIPVSRISLAVVLFCFFTTLVLGAQGHAPGGGPGGISVGGGVLVKKVSPISQGTPNTGVTPIRPNGAAQAKPGGESPVETLPASRPGSSIAELRNR